MMVSFATIPTPTNHEDVCYTPTIQQYQPSKKTEKISPESFDDEGRLWGDPHPSAEAKARCEGQEAPVLGASGDGDDHREVKQKHFFEYFYVLWMNYHTIFCSDASFYTEL